MYWQINFSGYNTLVKFILCTRIDECSIKNKNKEVHNCIPRYDGRFKRFTDLGKHLARKYSHCRSWSAGRVDTMNPRTLCPSK